jgi:hypothetical protein
MWTKCDPRFVFYREYRGASRNNGIFIADTGYPSREWMSVPRRCRETHELQRWQKGSLRRIDKRPADCLHSSDKGHFAAPAPEALLPEATADDLAP